MPTLRSTTVAVRLKPAERARWDWTASERDVTLSELIRQAVEAVAAETLRSAAGQRGAP